MNIKAICVDPDNSLHTVRVTVVATEWLEDHLMALVIDVYGHFKHLPLSELQVIDNKYLP